MSYSSPVTANTPTKYHDPLPEKTDVVIIGGGVIGVFSALYLIRAGYNVVICEKGVIAGEQSSRNWGWIRQQGRDEDELPIMMEAIDLWQAIDEELGGATGFKRNGLIYLAKKEKKLQQRKASIAMAKKMGLEGAALSTQQLSDTIGIAKAKLPWIGGTHTPNDARAEPWLAIPAVAQLIHSEGVKIKEHCAVRSLDIQHNKVLGVVTEHGYIATQHVVVCAGAWSSVFLQNHNIIIPQLSVRATVAQTTPIDMTYQGNAADEELAFGKRNDGGYSLALTDFLELFIGPDAFRHLLKWLPVAKTSLYEARYKPFPPNHYPDSWFKRHWTAEQQTIFEKMRVLNPTPPAHKVALIKSD